MADQDYYKILEVPKNANDNEIKSNYKKLALKYHPDKCEHEMKEQSEQKMREINEAYEILKDPKKRDLYDKYGKEGLQQNGMPMHGFDMNDIFNIFGGGGMGQKKNKSVSSIKIHQEVSLEEIYSGAKIKRDIERGDLCNACDATGNSDKKIHKCDTCNGKGKVIEVIQAGHGFIQQTQRACHKCKGTGFDCDNINKCKKCNGQRIVMKKHTIEFEIDKGVKDGDVITLENMGHELHPELLSQLRGQFKRSHIQIFIKEKEHPLFKRGVVFQNQMNPANISMNIKISLAESLCGFRKNIKHLDGRELSILETKPIKHNDVKFIKNEGLPHRDYENRKGDLFIKYEIDYPENLNDNIKKQIYHLLTNKKYKSLDTENCIETVNLKNYNNEIYEEEDDNNDDPDVQQCTTQ